MGGFVKSQLLKTQWRNPTKYPDFPIMPSFYDVNFDVCTTVGFHLMIYVDTVVKCKFNIKR